ncbi:uncharacterized protein EI90DRAFT_3011564 [Cantharellus anzutake]|uniref:uncharacterized protein n=1 Tax=Cantharellus anzutake TaxID=1750568 RepID=UPI001908D215|nr:uncharacterized protein EI90DRAFT_3011564 [Cantharellus anzutake]KAF8341981.1 hypothetical protein EI90DRAFT_3011564 [Cantharellus anzutake]
MTSLSTNNELHQCLAGLYLGGLNITSKVEWIYAKARHCHVLCAKGADRTNAWAQLERIMDESLLGYEDFPTYIKNLMLGGTHHHYSLVNEEGANAPQIKSCWDNIRFLATPQQEYETKSKTRYKLTPGNHAVALRFANATTTQQPQQTVLESFRTKLRKLQERLNILRWKKGPAQHQQSHAPQKTKAKIITMTMAMTALMVMMIQHWPVSQENVPMHDKMFKMANQSFTSEGKKATFSTCIEEIIVL